MTNASRGSWYVVIRCVPIWWKKHTQHKTKYDSYWCFPQCSHPEKYTFDPVFLHSAQDRDSMEIWLNASPIRVSPYILTSFSPAVWESSPRNRTTHIRQAGKCVFNTQSWSRTHLVTTQKDNLRNWIFVGIGLFYTKTVSWTDKVLCRWFSARLQ